MYPFPMEDYTMARITSLLPSRARSRRLRIVGAIALMIIAVTACGAGERASNWTGEPGAPASSTFPVTIPHEFGETVISAEPQRVVTVGYNGADFVLSLDVVPVGVRDFIGEFPEENRPWAQQALGGAKPEVVGGNAINFEKVAELRPDVIMGIYSFMERSDYDTLSKLAPTIPAPTADGGAATWQEETRITGKALGLEDKAEQVIVATEQMFTDARNAHPAFAGKTLALDFVVSGQPYKLGTDDPRTQVFQGLGFDIGATTEELSSEQLSRLDQDVIIVVGTTPEELAGNQLFQSLNAVKSGNVVYMGDYSTEFAGAIGFSSPLSLPYAVDIIVPKLAAVLDN